MTFVNFQKLRYQSKNFEVSANFQTLNFGYTQDIKVIHAVLDCSLDTLSKDVTYAQNVQRGQKSRGVQPLGSSSFLK